MSFVLDRTAPIDYFCLHAQSSGKLVEIVWLYPNNSGTYNWVLKIILIRNKLNFLFGDNLFDRFDKNGLWKVRNV